MTYGAPPWTFKGRALYQLQLVNAEEARKHIPPELRLVELFGYTLGGVYLARYDDSPAGAFDECVVMAGLVWNPPTSCAWAARVYVNSRDARDHGVACVGLPSRLAAFSCSGGDGTSSGGGKAWWRRRQAPAAATQAAASSGGAEVVELRNVQPGRRGLPHRPVARLQLPAVPASGFLGPRLRLSLPSFSGGTREHPALLEYSCDLTTAVMAVPPMRLTLPRSFVDAAGAGTAAAKQQQSQQQQQQQQHPEALDLLLSGRPLVCLAFSDMHMRVEQPQRLQLPAHAAAAQATLHAAPAFATVLAAGGGGSRR